MTLDYAGRTTPKPPMHPIQQVALLGLLVCLPSWFCSGWSLQGVDWWPSQLSSYNPPPTMAGSDLTPSEAADLIDAFHKIEPLTDKNRERLTRALPELVLPFDPGGPPPAEQAATQYYRSSGFNEDYQLYEGGPTLLSVGHGEHGQGWVTSFTVMTDVEVADDGTRRVGQRIPPPPAARITANRLAAVGVVGNHVLSYLLAIACALTLWRPHLGTRLLVPWAIVKIAAVASQFTAGLMTYFGMANDVMRTVTTFPDGTTTTRTAVLGGYGGPSIVLPLAIAVAGLIFPTAIFITARRGK